MVELNNGTRMPLVGLGTAKAKESVAYNAVLSALEIGYRHIDTAAGYDNEEEIGRAIRDSGVAREEIFVTTKLRGTEHRDPESALEKSLERLGLNYVDLFLVHWPVPLDPNGETDNGWDLIDTWAKMEKLTKTRSIGVSNCSIKTLEHLLPHCRVVPAVNQIELHPRLKQGDLVAYCKSKGIVVTAYCPLGARVLQLREDPIICAIAEKHGVSSSQILIAWAIARGTTLVPKSTNKERQKFNFTLMDNLPQEDMDTINSLEHTLGQQRICSAPSSWNVDVFAS
ncbi:hypothetical protein TRICI_003128 [Trichomonascus ciferrii]|uniref:NADP-dependent oxidoreductase domain-containing protein n=1 Tax=Trichomonascus ciferrii TaxID=44093 RepID=A0A642VAX7_9ASCO|nr:hypothetical protein TRICI_003128 [Trichomonascus ciferrii]